jgi:hypothetical protein
MEKIIYMNKENIYFKYEFICHRYSYIADNCDELDLLRIGVKGKAFYKDRLILGREYYESPLECGINRNVQEDLVITCKNAVFNFRFLSARRQDDGRMFTEYEWISITEELVKRGWKKQEKPPGSERQKNYILGLKQQVNEI